MNKSRFVPLQGWLIIWVIALSSCPVLSKPSQKSQEDYPNEVVFFDVTDLPVRIDEPRLSKSKEFNMECAVANRAGEQLLGLRLILLVIDPTGGLRSRITWTERVEISMYSIKTFSFHPELKVELRRTDQLFLSIDEVIGRDTIWRALGAEKALRAYSRGQHDLVPAVRTFANKYDPPRGLQAIPLQKKD